MKEEKEKEEKENEETLRAGFKDTWEFQRHTGSHSPSWPSLNNFLVPCLLLVLSLGLLCAQETFPEGRPLIQFSLHYLFMNQT